MTARTTLAARALDVLLKDAGLEYVSASLFDTEEAMKTVLRIVADHDTENGFARVKVDALPEEPDEVYVSVKNGRVVESVYGMLSGERSEWHYLKDGPYLKLDREELKEVLGRENLYEYTVTYLDVSNEFDDYGSAQRFMQKLGPLAGARMWKRTRAGSWEEIK